MRHDSGGYKYFKIFVWGYTNISKGDTNILIYLYPRGYKYFKIFVWGDTNILKYLYGGIQNLGEYKYFMTPAAERKSCFDEAENGAASSLGVGANRYARISCVSKLLWV